MLHGVSGVGVGNPGTGQFNSMSRHGKLSNLFRFTITITVSVIVPAVECVAGFGGNIGHVNRSTDLVLGVGRGGIAFRTIAADTISHVESFRLADIIMCHGVCAASSDLCGKFIGFLTVVSTFEIFIGFVTNYNGVVRLIPSKGLIPENDDLLNRLGRIRLICIIQVDLGDKLSNFNIRFGNGELQRSGLIARLIGQHCVTIQFDGMLTGFEVIDIVQLDGIRDDSFLIFTQHTVGGIPTHVLTIFGNRNGTVHGKIKNLLNRNVSFRGVISHIIGNHRNQLILDVRKNIGQTVSRTGGIIVSSGRFCNILQNVRVKAKSDGMNGNSLFNKILFERIFVGAITISITIATAKATAKARVRTRVLIIIIIIIRIAIAQHDDNFIRGIGFLENSGSFFQSCGHIGTITTRSFSRGRRNSRCNSIQVSTR